VLYYGGKLIHHGHLSSGQLVAFVFYMQSLFNSFSTLGNIYVALVQALGAADKGGRRRVDLLMFFLKPILRHLLSSRTPVFCFLPFLRYLLLLYSLH